MHVMDNPQQGNWIKKIYFDMVGFNQYGLYHDDLLEETDLVTEALRRLPPDLQVRKGEREKSEGREKPLSHW
jgi:hypothetical protein